MAFSSRPGDPRPRRVCILSSSEAAVFDGKRMGAVMVSNTVMPSGTVSPRVACRRSMSLVATLSNLKRGLAPLPWPVPRRLRVVMSTATRFPATMIWTPEGSLAFFHVAENRLATASMAFRSCFFKSMRPKEDPLPTLRFHLHLRQRGFPALPFDHCHAGKDHEHGRRFACAKRLAVKQPAQRDGNHGVHVWIDR